MTVARAWHWPTTLLSGKQVTWLSVCAGRQLIGRGEDSIFTRLHLGDPHWKVPRKLLARAFSADEIRCAEWRAVPRAGDRCSVGVL